jgi:hypothetical protein
MDNSGIDRNGHNFFGLRPMRDRIGHRALVGALCGYMLVTLVVAWCTNSNLSGLLGLMLGVPIGIISGVCTAALQPTARHTRDFLYWCIISGVLILYLAAILVVGFLNWKNGAVG